jgi:multidrug efflux system membrane fusion protein
LRDVPIYLDQIGKCASPEIVSIQAQAAGRIVAIHFKEGADIKTNDPLFTIDPRPYQAALNQAKADLEMSKATLAQSEAAVIQWHAQLEEAKADLAQNLTRQELNKTEFERARNLLQTNAVSKQEYDAREMAVKAGSAQIRSSKAVVARNEAQLVQAGAAIDVAKARIGSGLAAIAASQVNLDYTEIVSPINGRAGQRLVDLGNVVMPAMATPLLVIQRMEPIYVDFTIPENELGRVRSSMAAKQLKVESRVPEKFDAPREGTVFFLDNVVQEGTGTIKLRASIPNQDRFFWPGQFVNVRLILETRKNATLVPIEATQLGQTGPFVFVVQPDSTVQLRPIKLGLRYDGLIAVEGVKAGEIVVLTGQLMLKPGDNVAVVKDEKDAHVTETKP